jgi:hypothetical protein
MRISAGNTFFGKMAKSEISGEKSSLKNADFIKVDGFDDLDDGPLCVVRGSLIVDGGRENHPSQLSTIVLQ